MARQLQADGAQVGLLALLDSAPANAGYETVQRLQLEFTGPFARNLHFLWLLDFAASNRGRPLRRFMARKTSGTFGRRLGAMDGRNTEEVARKDLEEASTIDPAHFLGE